MNKAMYHGASIFGSQTNSAEMAYDKTKVNKLNSTNVQDAIDELAVNGGGGGGGGSSIDDTKTTTYTTWSSSKITNEIDASSEVVGTKAEIDEMITKGEIAEGTKVVITDDYSDDARLFVGTMEEVNTALSNGTLKNGDAVKVTDDYNDIIGNTAQIAELGDGRICGAIDAVNQNITNITSYSDEETYVGKWYGYDLYRKRFVSTTGSTTNTWNTVISGGVAIAMYEVYTVLSSSGEDYATNGNYYGAADNFFTYCIVGNELKCNAGTNKLNHKCRGFIYYIKQF